LALGAREAGVAVRVAIDQIGTLVTVAASW
jgi:hypothetical protein